MYPLRNKLPTHLRNDSGQRLCPTMRAAGLKVRSLVRKPRLVLEPQSQAAKFAAKKVRVSGDLSNDTIHIKSIISLPQQTAQAHPSQQRGLRVSHHPEIVRARKLGGSTLSGVPYSIALCWLTKPALALIDGV